MLAAVRTRAEVRRVRRRRWWVFAAVAVMLAVAGLSLVLGMTVGADQPMRGTAVQLLGLLVGGICLVAAASLGYEAFCRFRITVRRSPLAARPEPGD